jgi:hypothetical protein
MSTPREFWIDKNYVEDIYDGVPYLELRPDDDRMGDFIHAREVLPDTALPAFPEAEMIKIFMTKYSVVEQQIFYDGARWGWNAAMKAMKK